MENIYIFESVFSVFRRHLKYLKFFKEFEGMVCGWCEFAHEAWNVERGQDVEYGQNVSFTYIITWLLPILYFVIYVCIQSFKTYLNTFITKKKKKKKNLGDLWCMNIIKEKRM